MQKLTHKFDHRNNAHHIWSIIRSRRRLSKGGTIGLNGPTSSASKSSKDIIHISMNRKWEIPVLTESSKHSACNCSLVTFPELRSFLLFLFPALICSSGSGNSSISSGEATGTTRLGMWLGLKRLIQAWIIIWVWKLGIQILGIRNVVMGMGIAQCFNVFINLLSTNIL